MPRSARLTRKVERLVSLAGQLARSQPARTSECCYELMDFHPGSEDFLSDASCLNNDGVPLQLCLTSGPNGSGLRVIGDPGATIAPGEERYRASTETLLRTLPEHGLAELIPAAHETIARLLPTSSEALRRYTNGLIWIAASPDGPGVAFYVEMAPFDQSEGWLTVGRWLDAVLPDSPGARHTLATLSQHCVVASAGLEGSSAADARAKVYFRLRAPINLDLLQIELFSSPAIKEFLAIAMGNWGVDLQGLVLSAGFSLSTGAPVDVKVDICGHCVRHTLAEWSAITGTLTERFALAPLDLRKVTDRPDVEVAFAGIGLTTERQPRLNLYLKHRDPVGVPSTAEIEDALTDAVRYFQWTQSDGGSWSDFQLPVGASDQWVTAYVAYALARAGKVGAQPDATTTAERAADWLAHQRTYAAGWGYNGITGPDSDSTAMAIALFDELGRPVAEPDRGFLRDHWRTAEGIATYDGPHAWGEGHWDVTPWGYLGMTSQDQAAHRGQFLAALRSNMTGGGLWRSYWWRHPYYSTYVTLEVLERLGVAAPEPEADTSPALPPIDNPFDLACYVGILCLRSSSDPRLDVHLRTLLNSQQRDGAWSGSANLRVTENTCYRPWDDPQGTYYEDHQATVTTATVIRVLTRVLEQRCHSEAIASRRFSSTTAFDHTNA